MMEYKNLLKKSRQRDLERAINLLSDLCSDAGGVVDPETICAMNVENFLAMLMLNKIEANFTYVEKNAENVG